MKKSIFLFFAALLFSASAWADWCGNSFITVNGLWCTGSNSYVHDGGKFHGKNLGTLTTLELGGEFQVWPSSNTAGTLCYKIDNGTENSISLPKTGTEGSNSKHSGSAVVDLTSLSAGNHTIAVWFTHDSDKDDNGGSNFVATFTIAAAGEEPEPVADVTVHFINTPNWAEVACHHWIPNGAGTSWPGDVLSKTDEIAGYDVYTATFTGAHTSCIFNNNNKGSQTGDLTVVDGNYYALSTDTWYADKAAAEAALATPLPDETIYFVNNKKWTTINVYAWGGSKSDLNASWPGKPVMTKTAEKIGEYEVYSLTATQGSYKNLIFNDGSAQTADYVWSNGKYYWVGKDKDFVGDTKENAQGELTAPVVDVYTVVGSDVLLGTAWDLNNADNEMTKQADGSYILVKENVDLAKTGTYEYKVVKNHDWGWSVPEGNANLTLKLGNEDVDGTYNVTFTLNKELNALTTSHELVEAKKVIPECYVAGDESLTGQDWNAKSVLMTYDEATEVYTATLTAVPAGTHNMKVVYGGEWLGFDHLATPAPANVKEGDDKKIQFTLAEAGDVTVTYHATNGIGLTGNFAVPETKYYIAGTENLTGFDWKENGLEIAKDGDVYKHTFSEKAAGTYEFKITDGTWTNQWGFSNLAANYVGVEQGIDGEGNPNGNIKIVTEEAKNIIVIFDLANNKITLEGWEEKAPAEPVTVYFINSGEWAEVACYYWGGTDAPAWPGVQMTANGEVFEAEGWNVYAITFPGDNTSCIFNDNKAEGATQTGNLKVENGKYYCYENGIWYDILADVDLGDTQVYLKGDMNNWCQDGWCDMFYKEDLSSTLAYRRVWLEANTTYEFKIESAGTWLSNTGEMKKDNCTDWLFEVDKDNCKMTTEHAAEYTFIWDMATNKLSIEYPELVPEVMALTVTDMVFDGSGTFSGTDNMMGIEFDLVVGSELEYGVYSLDASSTVNFGGTLFTDVTGMIAPDMDAMTATAQVFGFYMGMYFQLNVEMSAGGSAATLVKILDGTASVDDATGELIISGNWEGDDIYVMAPGFEGVSYECPEVWFYVGGTTWETASIAAFGLASIEVDGSTVLVSGTVMSGMTGAQYELFVMGDLPVEEEPDYTRTVTSGQWGTICLPNASSSFTGATFYEVSSLDPTKGLWLDQLADGAQLVAGKPYIFYATATEITVTYTGEAVATPVAGAKGLVGTFTDIAAGGDLVGNYIIAENKVWVAGASATLPANRAYIANTVPTTEQPQLPGRRRVCMGENATTGLDQIVAPAGQAVKVIENGQLIIIRDGVKYNVQGQVIR